MDSPGTAPNFILHTFGKSKYKRDNLIMQQILAGTNNIYYTVKIFLVFLVYKAWLKILTTRCQIKMWHYDLLLYFFDVPFTFHTFFNIFSAKARALLPS